MVSPAETYGYMQSASPSAAAANAPTAPTAK